MIKRIIAGALCAGAMAVGNAYAAPPPPQTIFGAQYKGTISSGYDLTGLFGHANTSLAGLAYTETFTINTGVGYNFSSSNSEMQLGGSSLGTLAAVSASITINGITQSLTGAYYGVARVGYNSASGQYELFDSAENKAISTAQITDNFITGGVTSAAQGAIPTVFTSYNIAVNGTTYQNLNSSFQFHTYTNTGQQIIDTQGVLSPTSATPEPLTWALLMVGVGGIGLQLRRRQREQSRAAVVA